MGVNEMSDIHLNRVPEKENREVMERTNVRRKQLSLF